MFGSTSGTPFHVVLLMTFSMTDFKNRMIFRKCLRVELTSNNSIIWEGARKEI